MFFKVGSQLINFDYISDFEIMSSYDRVHEYLMLNFVRQDNQSVFQQVYLGKYQNSEDAVNDFKKLVELIEKATAENAAIVEWKK